MWIESLGSVIALVMTGLSLLARKLINGAIEKWKIEGTKKELIELIAAGAAKAQTEFVREAKKATQDGKLTKEEIKKAEKIAVDFVIETAKGPVKDLALEYTTEHFSSWIKRILKK